MSGHYWNGHYWIERDRLNSTGEGIVCAYCGIAYFDSQPEIACTRNAQAVQADLNSYLAGRARGSHD